VALFADIFNRNEILTFFYSGNDMRNGRREIKPKTLSDLNCCITPDMEFFLNRILPCIAQNYRPTEFNEFLAVRGGDLKLPIDDVKKKLGELGAKDVSIKQKENENTI